MLAANYREIGQTSHQNIFQYKRKYREVKWRGGTVRLAKIDNISHLLLFQVMSEINTYELDDCWNKR